MNQMENGFQRIKKIAKRVLPQNIETRMSSTSANLGSVMASIGNDSLSEFAVSTNIKCPPGVEKLITENNFECQFFDSDDDDDDGDEDCSDDSENVMEASTSFLSSMKALESIDLQSVDPETRDRLQILLEAAGLDQINSLDGDLAANQKLIKKLTSSVSEALDEAASALLKMKEEQTLVLSEPERDEDLALAHLNQNTEVVAQQLLKHRSSLSKTEEEGESLLSMAASSGYYELCQVLLATNTNVDDRGAKEDCTPLMEAAGGGFADIIQLLLHNKASINAKSIAGNTALHYAASGGHEKAVQVLLNTGSQVEAPNENGHTPLMEAASVGHVGVAKLLIEGGAEVNTQSREFKESALTLACYKGHIEMVEFLLDAGADINQKTDEMHTPLMEACIDGFVDVAKLLILRGAEVNMTPDSYESPLTLAACGGHVELAKLLISKGAIVDQRNDEGYTPLMEAAREGHVEVSALFLEHGADVNAITQESKETVLTLACCGGFLEAVDLLLRKGADLELGGLSPLIEAAQEGHLYLVKYLLNIGANVNAVSQRGDSALLCACGNGHTSVAEVLLKAGSNLEHQSNNGRTPLMKAAKLGHLSTVQFLISQGAAVNKATPDNEYTALSLACIGGHLKVVEFLLQNGSNAAHKLKDGSTMLIEAAKGGHAQVVSLLLDWSMMLSSNPSLSDKSKVDLWKLSAEEQTVKKNQIKRALLQLEGSCDHLDCADAEGEDGCKKCLEKSGSIIGQVHEKLESLEQLEMMSTMDRNNDNHNSNRSKTSVVNFREIENCKTKILEKDFEIKEVVRHEGDGCSGGIDSAVHDLSGPSSVSSSSSSSSSSSASEVDRFEDACFCCCSAEKPEASIERGESISSLVEGRKRACLDHFEDESPFTLKRERNAGCGNLSSSHLPSNSSIPTFTSTVNVVQNRIIAKGHRKLPQQPKIVASELRSPSLLLPPFPFETQKGISKNSKTVPINAKGMQNNAEECSPQNILKHKQAVNPGTVRGDCSSMLAQQKVINTNLNSSNANLKNHQHQELIQKAKIFQHQQALKVKHQLGSKIIAPSTKVSPSPLPPNLTKVIPPKNKNPNLSENNRVSSTGKSKSNQNEANDATLQTSIDNLSSMKISPVREHSVFPAIEVNAQTEANHDTALTLASAGGHSELVQLLLRRGADVEHRDKKGFTSLILASAAGHLQVVNILLEHGADTEAQLEQTKDTAVSLACSGGREEIAETLLKHGADREHRNASDYTPLCLAASAGQVNIVRLLLVHGAEINSRTSSRLGISPLMLASMNGHATVVSLLLDMGGDVNAQIETNRNTALTLACFQGKHEVVALLADRKANLEHRAKKGLTPLMEASGGGYVEVGRVLLDRGADVSALHGSSTKDTALTIAADKGHYRFVELLLSRGAPVDAKNKKGHTALWLACNGGHLEVVQLLVSHRTDPDACDNRRTSCVMAAFKKGHVKVVRWLVRHITQLPSDQECARCLSQIGTDKDLLKRCQQCMEIIINAKERQAAEANRNANSLLLELALEQSLVESKKAAAIRKREKRKQKKKGAKNYRDISESSCNQVDVLLKDGNESKPDSLDSFTSQDKIPDLKFLDCYENLQHDVYVIESQLLQNTFSSTSKNKSSDPEVSSANLSLSQTSNICNSVDKGSNRSEVIVESKNKKSQGNNLGHQAVDIFSSAPVTSGISDLDDFSLEEEMYKLSTMSDNAIKVTKVVCSRLPAESNLVSCNKSSKSSHKTNSSSVSKPSNNQSQKSKEDGWREVSRKCKKINVPSKCISRIIGRGGCNINAIREASGAHIDLDKMKNCNDGVITIKGSQEATQLATKLLEGLIIDPEKDIEQLIPLYKTVTFKGSKPIVVNSNPSDVPITSKGATKPACLMSISVPFSTNKTFSKSAAVKSQDSGTNTGQGINLDKMPVSLKNQPFDENPSNLQGPWKILRNDSSKAFIESSVTDKLAEECNKNAITTHASDSFNSFTSGQHLGGGFSFDMSRHDKSCISNIALSSSSSFGLIGGGDFSPFDNLLSKITETILQNKNKESKKDFASVAASCLSNGPSMLANSLLTSSSPKISTPEVVDSALQAKAPGFRRGTQLHQRCVATSAPSINSESTLCSAGLTNKIPTFIHSGSDEIKISPLDIIDSRFGTGLNHNSGPIGSGIVSSNENSIKNIFQGKNQKFSAACRSNLNPNAPNFTSVVALKNYESHTPSFLSSSNHLFALDSRTNNSVLKDDGLGSLIGKERLSQTLTPLASSTISQPPNSFMFDYGLANQLWKFDSSEPASVHGKPTDFMNSSLQIESSQFPSSATNSAYFIGPSFAAESQVLPDEPYSSVDECTFSGGLYAPHSDVSSAFMPPSFPIFSEAAFDQNLVEPLPPFGMFPSNSSHVYPFPGVDPVRHNTKPFFNMSSLPTLNDPQLLGWQQ